MKVAITSAGKDLQSLIDPRFGRCSYFVFYDTTDQSYEMVPNPGKDALDGAGPTAVQFIASRSVSKVVSGEFGIKIKSLLDSLGIQMIILKDAEMSVQKVIDLLNANKTLNT